MDPELEASKQRYKATLQQCIGNWQSTWRSDLVDALTQPITSICKSHGLSSCESYLWTLWDAMLDFVQHDPAANFINHDMLVLLIADFKSLGSVEQRDNAVDASVGSLWTDLPYLGRTLRKRWNDAPPGMNPKDWTNLNMFVARLTAAGVHDGALLGLWSVRMALETRLPWAGPAGPAKTSETSADRLLGGAVAWFDGAPKHLANLCWEKRSFKTDAGSDPGALGDKAKAGEVVGLEEAEPFLGDIARGQTSLHSVKTSGFNAERWLYWRARLEAISERRIKGIHDGEAYLALCALEDLKRWDDTMGMALTFDQNLK